MLHFRMIVKGTLPSSPYMPDKLVDLRTQRTQSCDVQFNIIRINYQSAKILINFN